MFQLIVIVAFFAFSMIRGLMKSAKENAEKQARLAQRGDPNRKQRVQGEIDAFLSEVSGGRGEQKPKRRRKGGQRSQENKQQAQRDRAELQRQQQIKQRREATRARRQAESQAATAPERRMGSMGSGISEHVDEYITQHVEEHIDNDVEEYVEATIVDSVEAHLGTRRSQMPEQIGVRSKERSAAAKSVVTMLKDPKGVRNAILINEILAPPRGLRK